jgi:hypothetical protein
MCALSRSDTFFVPALAFSDAPRAAPGFRPVLLSWKLFGNCPFSS